MNRYERTAFTLIELLVVVAIIAVLVAVLLPALSAARDRAKAIVCAHNIKTLGIAIQMYTDENNGKFMSWADYHYPFWNQLLYDNNYVKNLNGFVCPSYPSLPPNEPAGNWRWFTYGCRCSWTNFTINFDKIEWPSNYFILGDSTNGSRQTFRFIQWYVFYYPLLNSYNGIHMRHNNFVNFLFGDLHVEPCDGGRLKELGILHAYDKNMNGVYF